jgi:hypothetical protein
MKNFASKLMLCGMFVFSLIAVHQVNAAQQNLKPKVTTIPMLSELKQISSNQLRVTYDQPVDKTKGTEPGNYWIQSMSEEIPTGIATLGKNDNVNPSNSLTADKVSIKTMGNNDRRFILTFKQNIPSGKAYKMIICYVTKPGQPPYSGDNGSSAFIGL